MQDHKVRFRLRTHTGQLFETPGIERTENADGCKQLYLKGLDVILDESEVAQMGTTFEVPPGPPPPPLLEPVWPPPDSVTLEGLTLTGGVVTGLKSMPPGQGTPAIEKTQPPASLEGVRPPASLAVLTRLAGLAIQLEKVAATLEKHTGGTASRDRADSEAVTMRLTALESELVALRAGLAPLHKQIHTVATKQAEQLSSVAASLTNTVEQARHQVGAVLDKLRNELGTAVIHALDKMRSELGTAIEKQTEVSNALVQAAVGSKEHLHGLTDAVLHLNKVVVESEDKLRGLTDAVLHINKAVHHQREGLSSELRQLADALRVPVGSPRGSPRGTQQSVSGEAAPAGRIVGDFEGDVKKYLERIPPRQYVSNVGSGEPSPGEPRARVAYLQDRIASLTAEIKRLEQAPSPEDLCQRAGAPSSCAEALEHDPQTRPSSRK